ncbi:unnamed protein product, partial [Closterium sp. NIES-53]
AHHRSLPHESRCPAPPCPDYRVALLAAVPPLAARASPFVASHTALCSPRAAICSPRAALLLPTLPCPRAALLPVVLPFAAHASPFAARRARPLQPVCSPIATRRAALCSLPCRPLQPARRPFAARRAALCSLCAVGPLAARAPPVAPARRPAAARLDLRSSAGQRPATCVDLLHTALLLAPPGCCPSCCTQPCWPAPSYPRRPAASRPIVRRPAGCRPALPCALLQCSSALAPPCLRAALQVAHHRALLAMASLSVLTFNHEGRLIQFDTWLDNLQLDLQSDSRDSVSLFDHTSGAPFAPPATATNPTVHSIFHFRHIQAYCDYNKWYQSPLKQFRQWLDLRKGVAEVLVAMEKPKLKANPVIPPCLGPPRDEPRVFGHDKFNGDNFAEWSFKMENIFDHYDLLEVMEGTEKRPENYLEKSPWVRKSAQGYLLLGQALGSSQIRHIKPFQREPEKGPKAWAALKGVHAPATAAVAVVLELHMAALRIEEDEAVEEGVQKFFDLLTRLEGADLNYSELQKKTKFLALLPESSSSLIINLNHDLPCRIVKEGMTELANMWDK